MSTIVNTSSQRERAVAAVEELEKKAEVIKGLNLSKEIWAVQANRLYEQAKISKQRGDLVNAYIEYFKFNNIVTSILTQHNVDLRKKALEVSSILSELRSVLVARFEGTIPRSSNSHQVNHNQIPSKKSSDLNSSQGPTNKYVAKPDTPHTQTGPVSQDYHVVAISPNPALQVSSQTVAPPVLTNGMDRGPVSRDPFSNDAFDTSIRELHNNSPDVHGSMLRFPQVEHIYDASFPETVLDSDFDIDEVSQRYPSLDHVSSLAITLKDSQPSEKSSRIYGVRPMQDPKASKDPNNSQDISSEIQRRSKKSPANFDHGSQASSSSHDAPSGLASRQDRKSKNTLEKSRPSLKLKTPSRAPSRRWFSSSSISQTSFAFPHATVISTSALYQYLYQTSNPPSILLMDIRPREEFQKGHIDAKYIINIDPMILKNETTSSKIEAALQLCSSKERSLFNERHKVDLIVFYDQSSTSLTQRPIELGGNLSANPLQHLVSAIYEREFEKVLIRMPVLLSGGYQAWKTQYTKNSRPSRESADQILRQNHDHQHLNKSGHTSIPRVQVMQNTTQDWFNKPQDFSADSQGPKLNQDNTSSEQIDLLVDKLNQSAVRTPTERQSATLKVHDYFQPSLISTQSSTQGSHTSPTPNNANLLNQHNCSSTMMPPTSFSAMPKQAGLHQYNEHGQQHHAHLPNQSMLMQQQQHAQMPNLYQSLQPQVVSHGPYIDHAYNSLPPSMPQQSAHIQYHAPYSNPPPYAYGQPKPQHHEPQNTSKFEPLRMPQPEHYFSATSSQIPIQTIFPTPTPTPTSAPHPQATHNKPTSHHPNQSNSSLRRRKTFLDNPYYGFTTTNNSRYDPPPPLPKRPVPSQNMSILQPTRVNQSMPPIPQHQYQQWQQQQQYQQQHHQQQRPIVRPASTQNQMYGQKPMLPMHMASPTFESSVSQLGSVRIGITGLKNLGNTCFMNSVLQCLSATVPLARYFLDGSYRRHINVSNFLGTGGVLAQAFGDLIRAMWSVQYTFVSPITFRDAIAKFAPQFKGSDQQDSQELLGFLLDGLHEDLNLIVNKPPPVNDEDDDMIEQMPEYLSSELAWEKYLMRNSSIIVSLFQGQFRSKLQCTYCKQTSTTYNPFTYLSLPIPSRNNGTPLTRCLEEFVKEETLDGEDAWFCSRCKTRRRAIKRLTLSRLPDILLIHLKRFSFSGPFRDKLDTLVSYPLRKLNMSPYLQSTTSKAPTTYDLYAVSNHVGGLNGGHYTAQVRNGNRNQWCNFDDSRVSVCDESTVVSKSAYILFYVRTAVS